MIIRPIIVWCFLLPVALYAQRWELGLYGGATAYTGDLNESDYYDFNSARPCYGLFVRRHFNTNLDVRLNYMGGALGGDESQFAEPYWRRERGFSFTTQLHEASLMLEFDIFGHKRREGRRVRIFPGPYLLIGANYTWLKPSTNFNDQAEPNPIISQELINRDREAAPTDPLYGYMFGGGIKMPLGRKWMLGVEALVRPGRTDYLDGVSITGRPGNHDWFLHAGMTISYRIMLKDTDRDGIPNRYDLCPVVPGIKELKGCPDEDGDGIIDQDDLCPKIAGKLSARGCPDADNDGLQDSLDRCPEHAGYLVLQGCPDKDEDGIPDIDDFCPGEYGDSLALGCPDLDADGIPDELDRCWLEPGEPATQGCPDTDRDGIADVDDRCPALPGLPKFEGCPDADEDGIIDPEDVCPQIPGLLAFKGCPDSDNDSIPDAEDMCPLMAGPKENKGCPEIKKEDKKAIEVAVRNIEFENKSAELKEVSRPILDKVAEILKLYPNYHVKINGHTDNVGNAKSNLALSDRRAKTCRDYLIAAGIAAERLESKGYGKTKPIASNKTAKGRQKNRRVEFELIRKF